MGIVAGNMRKILIIEDDTAVRSLTLKILETEGFECLVAENGVVGIKLAKQYAPDLIICDIVMPETDGYEVLQALQQDVKTVMIPFIFLTAKSNRDEIRQGIELGADDYLIKPFESQELLGAINARFKKQEVMHQRLQLLVEQLDQFRQLMEAKDEMLDNFNQEVRRPLSNVKLAIEMLDKEQSKEQRERYLQILREEFVREIALLNQIDELQKLLTPENVNLLTKFNMLKLKTDPSA